jgi:hypothetical protein
MDYFYVISTWSVYKAFIKWFKWITVADNSFFKLCYILLYDNPSESLDSYILDYNILDSSTFDYENSSYFIFDLFDDFWFDFVFVELELKLLDVIGFLMIEELFKRLD